MTERTGRRYAVYIVTEFGTIQDIAAYSDRGEAEERVRLLAESCNGRTVAVIGGRAVNLSLLKYIEVRELPGYGDSEEAE